MSKKTVYQTTDEQFIAAVNTSDTIRKALLQLGCKAKGGNYEVFIRRAAKLSVDITHLRKVRSEADKLRRDQISNDLIAIACQQNQSRQSTLKYLDLNPTTGGNVRWITNKVLALAIDISHWLGQAHLKGKKNAWSKPFDFEQILAKDVHYNSTRLKERLIESGMLSDKCQNSDCRISHWHGTKLSLHLDHINGERTDNRLENLRLLCPNCHSLTPTYCRKKSSLD